MSDYNVTVIGNISSAGKVTVVPEESFLMKDKSSIVNAKPDVETFVTQDKTEWFWNEILENSNIKGYGNIYAENISAGTWEGSFWFNIQYKNINLLSVEKENYSVVGTNSFNINVENPSNGELSVISSDTSIATVNVIDNILTINPIKAGTVTITIISGETEDCYSAVKEFDVTITKLNNKLSVSNSTYSIVGDTPLTVNVTNLGGALTTKSSNTSVATISMNGNKLVITPKSTGSTTITVNSAATNIYNSATTTFVVKVTKGTNNLTIPKSTYTITNGAALSVTASNPKGGSLKVTSSDESIATVSVSGKQLTITPKTEGIVTITVTSAATNLYNSTTTTFKVNINHNYLNGICQFCGEKDISSLPAGLYDVNWNLKTNWQTLLNNGTVIVNNGELTTKYVSTTSNNSNSALNGILVVPNNITSFGPQCFAALTNLKGIYIPESLTTIGENAFYCKRPNISYIYVNPNNKNFKSVNGVLYNSDMTTLHKYPSALTNKTFTIPKSVTKIASSAFMSNTYIEYITIPGNVKILEISSFDFCTSLKSVVIEEGLTRINCCAFASCTSLTDIYLPNTLQVIESGAFGYVAPTRKIFIPASVTTMFPDVFISNGSTTVYCEASSKPSGWYDNWYNRTTAVYWGYTREQFNALN